MLLQPSVKPFVYGTENELSIPVHQFCKVSAHFSMSGNPQFLAHSIHSNIAFLAVSRSLQSSISKNFSLYQCALLKLTERYKITFTCCFWSSSKYLNCYSSKFLEFLKYIRYFLPNFFCSAFRTRSKAHIICRIQWYLSTIGIAFFSQVAEVTKYVFHISLTKYFTFLRSSSENRLK